jgi:NADPH-dependent 2,4-dienoyl-CoA reductase/sulfur reductase-like enzyme
MIEDLVIIGAGPAGLAAAKSASPCVSRIILIDNNPRLGGQYWRHLGKEWIDRDIAHFDLETGLTKIESVKKLNNIEIWSDTQVWNAQSQNGEITLRLLRQNEEKVLVCRKLIVATGAYDRSIPFPGWDIPGVMTCGGAQALLKGQGVIAGKKIIVAGSGVFLLPVASGLVKANANVVELLEANSGTIFNPRALKLALNLSKLKEALSYLAAILKAGVKPKFREAVVAAHANAEGILSSVTIAKLDRNWNIKKVRTAECDLLAVGYGFTTDPGLNSALGVDMKVDIDSNVVVKVNKNHQTSVSNIYAAGELTGIGGKDLALLEGEIAGLSAVNAKVPLRLRMKYLAAKSFANALKKIYPIRNGWMNWLEANTIICRCEEVSLAKLQYSVSELGASDSRTAKLLTRCGMGLCQGRICSRAVVDLVSSQLEQPASEKDRIATVKREVITPISLGVLAKDK